jgi:DNA polymerase-3 subunit delta
MKINPADVDNLINNNLTRVRGLLVYGPDNGLVRERVKNISTKLVPHNSDPFQLADFSFDKIKDDLSPAIDAIFSQSLSRKKRLIRVGNFATALPNALNEILSSYRGQNFILFYAGDLPPASSLRKFFETSKNMGAIACYHDEQASIKRLILTNLREVGFSIEAPALEFMENAIAGDRMLILKEIEKLITYMGDKKNISLNDVSAIIGNNNVVTIDELCQAVANRNSMTSSSILKTLFAENISAIAILRSLSKYFTRVYQVKFAISQGSSINAAMGILSPPVFFKNIDSFQQHVKSWSLQELAESIKMLVAMEAKCKKTGTPTEILCQHEILNLTLKDSCSAL